MADIVIAMSWRLCQAQSASGRDGRKATTLRGDSTGEFVLARGRLQRATAAG